MSHIHQPACDGALFSPELGVRDHGDMIYGPGARARCGGCCWKGHLWQADRVGELIDIWGARSGPKATAPQPGSRRRTGLRAKRQRPQLRGKRRIADARAMVDLGSAKWRRFSAKLANERRELGLIARAQGLLRALSFGGRRLDLPCREPFQMDDAPGG